MRFQAAVHWGTLSLGRHTQTRRNVRRASPHTGEHLCVYRGRTLILGTIQYIKATHLETGHPHY